MARAFRDLEVWKLAMDLSIEVYRLTEAFPKHEIYGLTSQMRRCGVSIPSNIAEGSARSTKRDFAHFISIARGSNAELQTQLLIALRLGYVQQDRFEMAESICDRVGQMLARLSTFLRASDVDLGSPPTKNQQRETVR